MRGVQSNHDAAHFGDPAAPTHQFNKALCPRSQMLAGAATGPVEACRLAEIKESALDMDLPINLGTTSTNDVFETGTTKVIAEAKDMVLPINLATICTDDISEMGTSNNTSETNNPAISFENIIINDELQGKSNPESSCDMREKLALENLNLICYKMEFENNNLTNLIFIKGKFNPKLFETFKNTRANTLRALYNLFNNEVSQLSRSKLSNLINIAQNGLKAADVLHKKHLSTRMFEEEETTNMIGGSKSDVKKQSIEAGAGNEKTLDQIAGSVLDPKKPSTEDGASKTETIDQMEESISDLDRTSIVNGVKVKAEAEVKEKTINTSEDNIHSKQEIEDTKAEAEATARGKGMSLKATFNLIKTILINDNQNLHRILKTKEKIKIEHLLGYKEQRHKKINKLYAKLKSEEDQARRTMLFELIQLLLIAQKLSMKIYHQAFQEDQGMTAQDSKSEKIESSQDHQKVDQEADKGKLSSEEHNNVEEEVEEKADEEDQETDHHEPPNENTLEESEAKIEEVNLTNISHDAALNLNEATIGVAAVYKEEMNNKNRPQVVKPVPEDTLEESEAKIEEVNLTNIFHKETSDMNEPTLEVAVVRKEEMNYKRRPQELKETYQEEDHGNPSYQNQANIEEELKETDQEAGYGSLSYQNQNNIEEEFLNEIDTECEESTNKNEKGPETSQETDQDQYEKYNDGKEKGNITAEEAAVIVLKLSYQKFQECILYKQINMNLDTLRSAGYKVWDLISLAEDLAEDRNWYRSDLNDFIEWILKDYHDKEEEDVIEDEKTEKYERRDEIEYESDDETEEDEEKLEEDEEETQVEEETEEERKEAINKLIEEFIRKNVSVVSNHFSIKDMNFDNKGGEEKLINPISSLQTKKDNIRQVDGSCQFEN